MNKIYLCAIVIFSFSIQSSLSINQHAYADIIPIVPNPPTNLIASSVSISEIDLSWTAPTNNGITMTGYEIDRSTDGGSTWSTIVSNTGSTSTTYSDTGLAHSTTYTYRVSTVSLLGMSSPSNTASATTFNIVSSAPSNLSATATSSSQINLSWSVPSNNGGAAITGYKIDRSTDGGSTWSTIVANTGTTSTAYSNTGLAASTTYTYRVSAINSAGTSSPSNTASATTPQNITTPQPPTGLAATAISSSQINLSWSAPSNNGGATITGYEIERSADDGSTWSTIVSNTGTTSTAYSNTGLTASTTYTYRVSAINSVGVSSKSNISSATTLPNITAPQPPTGLTATAISSSQINLSWSPPSNNGGAAITGYEIDRSTDSGSTWSAIASDTGSTSTTYSDTGLSPSTAYTYRVSAINSAGTSQPSNTASATTNSLPIIPIKLMTSGLVGYDPLNNETETQQQLQANSGYWRYGGDAPAENAPYDFFRDTQGLHVGAQSPGNGTYAGYFAVSPNTNADLFHAIITTPVGVLSTTQNDFYENGLYVQTSTPSVNYVSCFSDTSQSGTIWAVGSVTGNANQGTTFNVLWVDTSANQPLTRDCTLVTNGQNMLKAYIDGNLVYENNTLNLQMPSPFNSYLEPQSSYSGQLLNGTYTDYYATTNENVTVNDLPSNAANIEIVDGSGNVLASSSGSSGTAILDIGKYRFPLSANIKAYDSNDILIASTSGMSNIYGGDVFSVTAPAGPSVPSAPTGLAATAISSSQINLSWSAPSNNGGATITGYEIDRSTNSGSTWSTIASNTGSTSTTYSDTGLAASTTYTYRVSAINSAGTSSPSNIVSVTSADTPQPGITLDGIQSTSGTTSSSNQITLTNFNTGTGSNNLLVVGVSANNNDVDSITFGGVPLTMKAKSFVNNDAEFWYLVNPSGTGNIVVTMSGSTQIVVGAYSLSGVNQTDPIPTKATHHNSAANSPTISITTVYPNDLVLDLPSIYGGSTLDSSTCTQQWDANVPNEITGASSSTMVSSASTVTCGWTASSSDLWDDVAIEIQASG